MWFAFKKPIICYLKIICKKLKLLFKAVIVFETCSHGWCVECLQKRIAMSKDEKLHCKYCPSCGNIRNATRFLKKCRTEGLLVGTCIFYVIFRTSWCVLKCCKLFKKFYYNSTCCNALAEMHVAKKKKKIIRTWK